MTVTLEKLEKLDEPILIDGLSWREFKVVEQLLSRPGVRLSFLDGVLEIRRMPGRKYETAKQRISTLVDLYLEYAGIDFTPTGSVTLESETGRVKREADLSYELSCPASKTHIVWYNIITFRKSQCLLKTFSVLRQRKLCNKH